MKRTGGLFRLPAWKRYVAVLGLNLAAVLGRLALDPWWGDHQNRHLVFLPTVMLSAWWGGLGPGVLSAGLCTAAIDYLWTEPRYQLFHPAAELALFFVVAVAMSKLVDSLREARARADAARFAGEQMLDVVAHDLRSPLMTIKATSALMRRRIHDPDLVLPRIDAIERAVDRSEKLIRDLVDATHAERGALSVTLQNEKVDSIAREVAEMFGPLVREKGVRLEEAFSPGDAAVRCDRDRLLQVLGNLLSNALKFTPEGGNIRFGVRVEHGSVWFEVADSGPGIRPEYLPHIFERYWHADKRGTGLGLFIAQSIVRAHGADIQVHSQPGAGARFSFALRRAPSASSVEPPASERSAPSPDELEPAYSQVPPRP